ncbi:hypothetical protein ASPWEDRAFT_35745 [Aspergillus wentii DTO 134E9]|uniref:Major facilitator superfamily (MFS) profile domain-containing protein n=1 Tax=Aspergillus wentii DTO 134E9 TaxID=1073089 RepID=A0A1L9RTI6_ASPWE|nr:uncharacterized protein ASPWEDRAFT_35745 [Aspergillus wentii DTO 134E9]KAI9933823.1 hypothetical protein MW887_004895 [Aspergillus wentii]OJJ38168.1 hypothetical protein ASPWEDRAFT_35745 [Aspergillus wentii DTO 134E9]
MADTLKRNATWGETAGTVFHSKFPASEKEPSSPVSRQSMDRASTLVDFRAGSPRPPGYEDDDDIASLEFRESAKEREEYPESWKLVFITIGLCLCVFCTALDNTIMATAVPKITDQFNSLADVGWYGSAYLLTTCSLTLMFGKLYTFYSIKWIYLIALCIFELGSFICGVTPNSLGLILGRAVAGLGGAGLFSGSILIIRQTVPLQQRPIYTGLMTSMFGMAGVVGPLIGGALTDHVSWRWCFYINLPIGAVTALFIMTFFKAPKCIKERTSLRAQLACLDLPGTIFFLPAIVCVLLALQWGGVEYAWNDVRMVVLFVLFGVLISIFMGIQVWQGENATVPPRLIRNRNVWGSAFFTFCLGAAFFICTYYLPIWFQAIKGASATKSGIMNLPMILAVVICSVLSGYLVSAIGYYTPFMIVSSVLVSIGGGLLTTLQVDSGYATWIGYQALFGIGVGFGALQPFMVTQTALAAGDIPIATAFMMFSQGLGGAIFVSVGQNVFTNELVKNVTTYAPTVDAAKVAHTGATMLRDVVAPEALHSVLRAYDEAITNAFYVGVAISVISLYGPLFVEWISVRGRKIEPPTV